MFIQTEKTPNPETIKFIPGQTVMGKGVAEFKTMEQASPSPLAQRLFRINGVQSVFFGPDFISVTKNQNTDWAILKTMTLSAIMEHFSTGQPVMNAQVGMHTPAANDIENEIITQICELIDTRVRPAVQQDGGDIEFESYEDGVVTLRMRGACSGCPSSSLTLKSGIETMLKHFIPEVVEVRQADSL